MAGDAKCAYGFRRIGLSATVMGVKDKIILNGDVTRVGRHSGNDFFLDSSQVTFMVSRWHAEIHCVQQDSERKFLLRDSSLNGTYINNRRVKGNQELVVGDKVTFGHTNGKNIKPGMLASPIESEFDFVFENIDEENGDTNSSKRRKQPDLSVGGSMLNSPGSPALSLVELPALSSVCGGSSQETPGSSMMRKAGVSRRLMSDVNDRSGSVILKDISNSPKCRTTGLVNLDMLVNKDRKRDHLCIFDQSLSDDSDIIGRAIKAVEDFDTSDSEDDIFSFNYDQPSHESANNKISHQKSFSTKPDKDIFTTEPNNRAKPSATKSSPPSSCNSVYSITVGGLNSTSGAVPLNVTVPATSASTDKTRVPPTSTLPKVTMDEVCSLGRPRSSARNENSRRKAKHVPKQSDAVPCAASESTTAAESSQRSRRGRPAKRKQLQNTGARKRLSLSSSVDTGDQDDSDDYNYHYDGEKCDSFECTKPAADQVSWVQCDDCDKWYHIQCAGCNYDLVKKNNTEFHCGCL